MNPQAALVTVSRASVTRRVAPADDESKIRLILEVIVGRHPRERTKRRASKLAKVKTGGKVSDYVSFL